MRLGLVKHRAEALEHRARARNGTRVEQRQEELGVVGLDLLKILDVAHLVTDDHEIITVIEGEGATPADTRRVTEWLAEHRPDASVEVHHGGQPLYPYLVSVE